MKITRMAGALVIVGVTYLSACSSESDIKESIAEAGQQCRTCDTCCDGMLACCKCGECMDLAADAKSKSLLVCATSQTSWTIKRGCPGGVRVWCVDGEDLHISCKDEQGNEIPG